MRIQTPKPVIPSEIAWAAAFSMLDPNGNGRWGSMIASKTRIGRKRSAERGKAAGQAGSAHQYPGAAATAHHQETCKVFASAALSGAIVPGTSTATEVNPTFALIKENKKASARFYAALEVAGSTRIPS
ncbi:hypothetical protein IVA95_01700 [Bradyrhizobium sp. 157]|uniref:hypothetical protein n=1 Tax=Bradyrhizobium sp. 157 TaxID=2782631 RepID=UPI001FFB4BC9|nr:hypothetical protein [Bradyrhizobium sp. 157]MCK1636331.1 hypothetical protein [Bradyrhizobium sp. 157]